MIGEISIKDAVYEALTVSKSGMSADDLLSKVEPMVGDKVNRDTMIKRISDLRTEGWADYGEYEFIYRDRWVPSYRKV